ncbi:MAG: hypothetical protein V1857_06375, partial [archaeon]
MEPILYLLGFNVCLLVALFSRGQLIRKARNRFAFKGIAIVASAVFMLGLVAAPVHAAVLVEYYHSNGPVRPWDIACDVSANRAFFTEPGANRIGLIEWGPARFTWWVIPSVGSGPYGISLGPEIATDQGTFVWFTEETKSKIGRLNPLTGEIIEWDTLTSGSAPRGIWVDAKNKTVWFTEYLGNRIGSLTYLPGIGWKMAEYSQPGMNAPESILVDKDGVVWFTENGGSRISRFNPAFGEFTRYQLSDAFSSPWGIAYDKDGFIWFTSTGGNKIGRLNWWKNQTIGWTITTDGSQPHEIQVDQDYNVWFTEFAGGKIGKFVLGVNTFYEYPTPTPGSQPHGLCVQEPGTVAFTEAQSNRIG